MILGRKGVVGSVYYVPGDYWPHDTTLWVKHFHNNHPRFVYYFFKQMAPTLSSLDVGSANPTLNRNHVHPTEILWPPVSDQKRISELLGSLDDKIDLNRRMNETLEAMARAIFKSWFVDFDPVRAKMEGRQPIGVDVETTALFPDSFSQSLLGLIPELWTTGTIGREFRVTMGQSPPGDTYNELGNRLPFFQGRADFGFRFPNPRVYCSAPARQAEPGDTLVSVRAPVGDINMAAAKCCIGRGVAAVRHKSGSRSFTYQAMYFLEEQFARFDGEGTVFGAIGKEQFQGLRFVIPEPQLLRKFEHLTCPLDDLIENNEKQSRTLITLRDSLLPRLLSGTIQIQDAESTVEAHI